MIAVVGHHLRHRGLDRVHDLHRCGHGHRVAAGRDLRRAAHVLRGRRRAQAGVVAVPQRHVVRHHHAAHRVHQVLGLQVGELLLLVAQLHVEEVVVDLRHDRLQRHAQLDSSRAYHRGIDAARIHKPRRPGIRDRRLFKEARWMPGRRNLPDALSEWTRSPADFLSRSPCVRRPFGCRLHLACTPPRRATPRQTSPVSASS